MSDAATLVTGASRGIGRAVAQTLASRGHRLAINFRADSEGADATVAMLREQGADAVAVQADVGSADEVEGMFARIEDELGPVEVLVNNAGKRSDALALRMSDAAWNEVLRTNLTGPFLCCRRALRTMLSRRRGRIVNVSSVAGLKASPGQVNYAAAKAGLIGMTRTMAAEVASRGITINAIAPGLVETELTATLDDRRWDELIRHIPQKRAGPPEDIAGLAAWLCSDEAAYVTGSVFVIDGGMTA